MDFPPELHEAWRRGTAVLVAGTGCGELCGQPGWRGRIEALAAAMPTRGGAEVRALLERDACAAALVLACDRLGRQAGRVVARTTAAVPDRLPGALMALASASWRSVITTGFDDSWARALAATGQTPVVLSAGEAFRPQRGPALIHAFGRAARPETLCLGPVDLSAKIAAYGLEQHLRELVRECTFLYVGFQAGDPDLEWLVGRVLGPAARGRQHFALVTGGVAVSAALFRGSFGLQPIAFAGSLEAGLAAVAGAAVEAAGALSATTELELDVEDAGPAPPPVPEAVVHRSISEAVDQHVAEQRWEEAADGLGRLVDLEPDAAARAKLLYARALMLRDRLQDRAGAIPVLQHALEEDPAFVPAWDALEPLQRGSGDPIALRRCYGRALRTLGRQAEPTLARRLWGGLAEVSWSALGDHATAVAAFEAARTFAPDDEAPERALAALYLKVGPSAADKAVAAHQALAARAPDDPEPYRVLERLWTEEGAPERASWARAVLAQLGQATGNHAGPIKLNRLGRPTTLARTLSEPLWESLYHPDEDRVLSTLFLVLGPSLAALVAEREKPFPPRGAEAVPPVDPSATRPSRAVFGPVGGGFAPAALAHVARALEVPCPALGLARSARRPITVRLRPGAPRHGLILDRRFADRASEVDLLFAFAQTVALLRPPWSLRFGARATETLALGLRAALALGSQGPPGHQKRDVRRLLRHLREARLDVAQEQVAALASELAHRSDPPDLARWLAGVELGAARAALTITGDLNAAVSRVSAEESRPGSLAPGERVKDLLAFAVSEEHFAVRAALALDVSEGAAALH
jgi:tetratricopeptide (TPR) repeat protein